MLEKKVCSSYYNTASGTMASLGFYDNQYMVDMAACIRYNKRACVAYTIDAGHNKLG